MTIRSSLRWALGAVASTFIVSASLAIAGETSQQLPTVAGCTTSGFPRTKPKSQRITIPPMPMQRGSMAELDSWRCKECHGWDYQGKDGGYGKGKHFTGIVGISGAAGKDPANIAALLRAGPHGYTDKQLSDADVQALALFVTSGQIDMGKYLNAEGKPIGDGAKGEAYFNTLCAGCHGVDGAKIKDAPLGAVADNAREMMHKVLNGQPGESMPALRVLDHQIAADIVVHLQTLPK